MPTTSCKHIGCECPAKTGSAYCSDACRRADEQGDETPCQCGHADCG